MRCALGRNGQMNLENLSDYQIMGRAELLESKLFAAGNFCAFQRNILNYGSTGFRISTKWINKDLFGLI